MNFLKNHPFPVEAFFESSVVLTFAAPKAQVQALIPECLELDVFDDLWAFIAVAMVQTKGLRPKGFPKVLGNDFFLIGYRVFVRFTNQRGKRLRGLYILKSQTDKRKMELFGNIFTHYNYSTTDIRYSTTDIRVAGDGGVIEIQSNRSDIRLRIDQSGGENISLPDGSPFADWKEARRFAGPLPFTFTYDPVRKEVLIIEGVREEWKPMPVRVMDQHFGFIDGLKMDTRLANAFIIRNIPYYWKKGKIEQWKPKEEISRVS